MMTGMNGTNLPLSCDLWGRLYEFLIIFQSEEDDFCEEILCL